MTETNHSQTIPVSPNVFPTKNKKMTKRKDYVIDTSKIKTLKDVKNIFECLGIICDMSILEESGPRYELAKEYFVIPYVEEPRKSLEEIQKELDKKFEEIIEKYKRKSYASKLTAERKYEDKFDRISYNFQCAVNNGVFPRYFSLTTSGNASIGNTITHNFVIKPDAIGVGYWEIDPNIQVYRKTKPNRIVRYFSRLLLDFHWKDTL
jgi:hypothetical protein